MAWNFHYLNNSRSLAKEKKYPLTGLWVDVKGAPIKKNLFTDWRDEQIASLGPELAEVRFTKPKSSRIRDGPSCLRRVEVSARFLSAPASGAFHGVLIRSRGERFEISKGMDLQVGRMKADGLAWAADPPRYLGGYLRQARLCNGVFRPSNAESRGREGEGNGMGTKGERR